MSQTGDIDPKVDLPADFVVRFTGGAFLVTFRHHEACQAFSIALLTLEGLAEALEAAIASPNTVWVPYQSMQGVKRRMRRINKEK
jgi:GGDEF domain-containing protein